MIETADVEVTANAVVVQYFSGRLNESRFSVRPGPKRSERLGVSHSPVDIAAAAQQQQQQVLIPAELKTCESRAGNWVLHP